jgi:hypothetical protein
MSAGQPLMTGGSLDAPRRARASPATQRGQQSSRPTLVVALCLGGAVFGIVRLAERMAPSDSELVATVLAQADTVTARRALHALAARVVQRNRPIQGLDEVISRLAPADREFLAQFRPDLLRHVRGAPR